ncbi:hypothetical protein L6452_37251 [Arctium lappa]|uniref:Uncharacterized protein n=1 Tax=Arctium lappa TaxID=4217 RepID=A0ACB8Y366_ARCLA|nr:hypothetical protein L6452_37251 [Arctium lappa]
MYFLSDKKLAKLPVTMITKSSLRRLTFYLPLGEFAKHSSGACMEKMPIGRMVLFFLLNQVMIIIFIFFILGVIR